MESFGAALGLATSLGLLTAVSPCPLATNIAAVSYIARRVDHPLAALWCGLLYALGRMAAYTLLGCLLAGALLASDQVAAFLQKYVSRLLGPLLIVAGVILLELVEVKLSAGGLGEKLQKRVETLGIAGGGVLGFVFALSFCPLSAVLFFTNLLDLAVRHQSPVVLPAAFGLATALPVVLFAVIIAFGAQAVGKAYDWTAALARGGRWVAGGAFVVVGCYLTLVHIYGLFT